MKHITKIYTVVFLAIIFGVFLSAIAPKITERLPKTTTPTSETHIPFNAEEKYPFKENASDIGVSDAETEETPAEEKSTVDSAIGKLRSTVSKIKAVEDRVDNMVTEKYPHRMSTVLINKAWNKYICGMNMTTDLKGTDTSSGLVVERADGLLAYVTNDSDETKFVQALTDFSKKMNAQGRDFLLFEPLVKAGNLDKQYLNIFHDYAEEKDVRVNDALSENGVNFVSCMEKVEEEGLELSEMFFRTDHHWLPQTGLWACGLLAEELNETAGYQINSEIFGLSNYDISYLPNFFLGSQGRKVTKVYAKPDDFPIIMPKYDSDLTVFHSYWNDTLSGTIADTMYQQSYLEESDIHVRNAYSYYGYGDEALIQIHNNNLSDGNRILFIKVSFADCMAPYLSNMAEYVDLIDLRLFHGSLETYIEQTDPDTVVVIYGTSTFAGGNEEIFDFS